MIYVMGDIHGDIEKFHQVMGQIKITPEDTLYILGDVIDRGVHGIAILREIMITPNIKMILGNHEHMMLCNIDDDYHRKHLWVKKSLWMHNHGYFTYKAYHYLDKNVQKEMINYLKSLPLNIDIEVNQKKYKLVHGAPEIWYDYGEDYYFTDETEYALWHRLDSKDKEREFDYCVVFGHTTTTRYQDKEIPSIYKDDKFIGMDCGCGFEGKYRLACLRLDDMKEFYSD